MLSYAASAPKSVSCLENLSMRLKTSKIPGLTTRQEGLHATARISDQSRPITIIVTATCNSCCSVRWQSMQMQGGNDWRAKLRSTQQLFGSDLGPWKDWLGNNCRWRHPSPPFRFSILKSVYKFSKWTLLHFHTLVQTSHKWYIYVYLNLDF